MPGVAWGAGGEAGDVDTGEAAAERARQSDSAHARTHSFSSLAWRGEAVARWPPERGWTEGGQTCAPPSLGPVRATWGCTCGCECWGGCPGGRSFAQACCLLVNRVRGRLLPPFARDLVFVSSRKQSQEEGGAPSSHLLSFQVQGHVKTLPSGPGNPTDKSSPSL